MFDHEKSIRPTQQHVYDWPHLLWCLSSHFVSKLAISDDRTISDGPTVNDDTLSRQMAWIPQHLHSCCSCSVVEESQCSRRLVALILIGVAGLTDRTAEGGADHLHLEQRSKRGRPAHFIIGKKTWQVQRLRWFTNTWGGGGMGKSSADLRFVSWPSLSICPQLCLHNLRMMLLWSCCFIASDDLLWAEPHCYKMPNQRAGWPSLMMQQSKLK